MKLCGALALLFFTSIGDAANCYVLQNNTDAKQTFHFRYTGLVKDVLVSLTMIPRGRYPPQRPWCWNTPDGYYGSVQVDSGSYRASWTGQPVMGNGPLGYPSGTYSLNPPPPQPLVSPSPRQSSPAPPRPMTRTLDKYAFQLAACSGEYHAGAAGVGKFCVAVGSDATKPNGHPKLYAELSKCLSGITSGAGTNAPSTPPPSP